MYLSIKYIFVCLRHSGKGIQRQLTILTFLSSLPYMKSPYPNNASVSGHTRRRYNHSEIGILSQ